MSGSGSVVEHLLAKERVGSSNLLFRSITFKLKSLRFPLSISYENNTLVATLVATDSTFINKVALRGIVVSASLPNIYYSNNCWVGSPIGIGGL